MPAQIPHAEQQYRIGDAARASGVSASNIRYYEKEGLLPSPTRGDNSYRAYSASDLHKLRFIRLCRAMDMSLQEVRTLLGLDLTSKEDCVQARVTLDEHLGHVSERLAELKALEKDLKALRLQCEGHDDQCGIIGALHRRADAQAPGVNAKAAASRAHRHV